MMTHSLLWKVPLGLFGFDGSSALLFINNKGSVIVLYIKNFYI